VLIRCSCDPLCSRRGARGNRANPAARRLDDFQALSTFDVWDDRDVPDPASARPSRFATAWPLTKLVLRRVGLGIVIMFVVSILVFLATQALPGDAAVAKLGRNATPESLKAFREQFHLDKPLVSQYFAWVGNLLQGHFGQSLASSTSVSSLIGQRIQNSLVLLIVAALIGIPLGLGVGVVAATKRDTAFDHVTSLVTLALAALPEFVIGIALVVLFATNVWHVFPAASILDPDRSAWGQLKFVFLPALTLALAIAPYIARMVRASMIEVLESDYVAMARLKGLKEHRVVMRHAFVNASGPTLQVLALVLAYLAGGVVVVETVFQYPGIGLALVNAIQNRDLPVVQALVLLIALVYTVLNIGADVVTTMVSPRLRTQLK
jgi:peptide/nickel transport system permease protein